MSQKTHTKPVGHRSVPSSSEEATIANSLDVVTKWGFPLTRLDIRDVIKKYLDKQGKTTDVGSDLLQNNNNNVYQPLSSINENEKVQKRKGILAQTLVTGAVMLSSASCGMPVGYSAILLPQLSSSNDSMQIDEEIGSWIASIHSAATPLGSLLSGLLMDRFGRKLALQLAAAPLIFGWILIAFSNYHSVLLLGRMMAGISAGLTAAAGQVLIGEISEPYLRGMFSSVPFASYSFGILLVYALGWLLPWRLVAGLSTILPMASLFVFFFLPESPVWLVRNAEFEKAIKSLLWLRGGNKLQAKKETEHLIQRFENEAQNEKKLTSTALFEPEVIKPLIIINIFNILQILSGTYLIVFYSVDILKNVHGTDSLDHFVTAILTACVRFIFSIVGSALLTLIGRRTLALTSGVGTTLSTIFLATLLYQNCQVPDYGPAALVLIYVATNTMGFMILPGVMMSELFPARVRGVAGGFTFMIFNFTLFGVAKLFPFVKNSVGVSGVFWIFASVGLVASFFLYLALPETKGQTLSEIEDYFQKPGFFWVGRRKDRTITLNQQLLETEKLSV